MELGALSVEAPPYGDLANVTTLVRLHSGKDQGQGDAPMGSVTSLIRESCEAIFLPGLWFKAWDTSQGAVIAFRNESGKERKVGPMRMGLHPSPMIAARVNKKGRRQELSR